MKTRSSLSLALLLLLLAAPSNAENWPHWRGPDRNGTASGSAPLTWSPDENVVWRTALPELSGATPIIWEDRIYLNVADGAELELWALDRTSGEVVWRRHLDDRNENKRKGNMSSPSPVTDGTTIWVMTGTGVFRAFDAEGQELWNRDLQKEYGKFGILHGYSSSPLLHNGSLYVQVLHGFHTDDPSYLMRIDAGTGETTWRVERPTDAPREAPDAYTTPALLSVDGRAEIVISGADYVTGHDPADGAELWRVPGLNPSANPMQRVVASPVVDGHRIYAPSRVKPLLVLDAAARSANEAPKVAWSTDHGPDVPTPVIAGEHLYILSDRGIMWAFNTLSGDVIWGPERVHPSTYSASPVVADGKIYVTNEAGLTTVVAAAESFEILAENDIGEYTLSSMAIADGQIFLRTADHLYCIADSEPAGDGQSR
jgi:outer membrane protein assembly factor BamB